MGDAHLSKFEGLDSSQGTAMKRNIPRRGARRTRDRWRYSLFPRKDSGTQYLPNILLFCG